MLIAIHKCDYNYFKREKKKRKEYICIKNRLKLIKFITAKKTNNEY